MANGKASDTLHLCAKMLKWTTKETKLSILNATHHAFICGFSHEWQENWIQSLHKGVDRNLLTKYHMIMINSIMAKLFSTILEMQLRNGPRTITKEHMVKQVFALDITL